MDCNECQYLLFDEEEQDYLKSAIKYTVPHWCEKYQKRVFHHPYKEPRIYPCRECLTEREKTMGNNKTEVKILTQEEWRMEGRKRFGLDFKNWKFKCPKCGNIASGAEFKEAGAEPNAIYQECIGRYVKGAIGRHTDFWTYARLGLTMCRYLSLGKGMRNEPRGRAKAVGGVDRQ